MSLSSQEQQDVLTTQNGYRSKPEAGTPALQWDSTLATGAQAWADNLAANYLQTPSLQSDPHSHVANLGENIAMCNPPGNLTAGQLADIWGTKEKPNFKPGTFVASTTACPVSTTGNWRDVGHYTQMIWRTTTSVGCGIAKDGTNTYLVCRYSPQGNADGVGVPSPQPVTLAQISALDANDVFGVDAANNVYWYTLTDGAWTRIQITGKQIKQVSVAADGTLCGLDTSGAIWQCSLTSSPQVWTAVAAGPVAFKNISCGSANNIWAIGTDSTFYQYTGTSWAKITPGSGSGAQVSVASDGTVWEIAYTSGLYSWTSGGWASPSWIGGGVTTLSCGSATNLWVVGFDNLYYVYDGSTCKTYPVGSGGAKQVSVASSDQAVWTLGTNNQISRWTNPTWTPLLM
ncbi:MAG TPA: CAP domain-containing protein [Ktedonobacteraceae bacterium]